MKVRLGDYIQEYSVRNRAEEEIPVYSVTNTEGFCTGYFDKDVASNDRSTYKIVPRGCFAYNPSRINVGSVDWQRHEDRVIVSPLYVVFSVSNGLLPQYLYYFLKSNVALTFIRATATGSVRDNLRFSMLQEFSIEMRSIEGQTKVIQTLDSIQKLIKLYKLQLRALDTLIKARFVEMFGATNEREKVKLSEVVESNRIITYGMVKPGNDVPNGVIIIKVKDFPNGRIESDGFLHADRTLESKYARSRVKEGDLLFSIRGTVGRTAFVPKELKDANITQDTARLSIDQERFDAQYIRYALASEEVQREIEAHVKGVAMRGISLAELREIRIPCPHLHMQKEFGAFVSQVDKSKAAVQAALDKTQVLFDSLMQEYFG